MKKLIYKNEFYSDITDEEAETITNHKGIQISFKGELLKKSQMEIRKYEMGNMDRKIVEYTTEELKEFIGTFEDDYKRNYTGEVVRNDVLGHIHQGIVDWCLREDVIRKRIKWNREYWAVVIPGFPEWDKKFHALGELNSRRGEAKKINQEGLNKLADKMSIAQK